MKLLVFVRNLLAFLDRASIAKYIWSPMQSRSNFVIVLQLWVALQPLVMENPRKRMYEFHKEL